jgi:acyl-CoA oxidase
MTNPKLRAFIPLFYLVWSDDFLSQKEVLILHEFIGSQSWLSLEEKNSLFAEVDVLTPPSRELLSEWRSQIEKAIKEKPSVSSVFEISILLSESDRTIIVLGPSFV